MKAQSARRFRLTAIFAISAILALGSVWLNMVLKRSAGDNVTAASKETPDYYMDNFRYFKLKFTGEADYELKGKKLTHYPDNDAYLVNFPVMESLDEQQRLQITYSDWAFAEDENSKIHLHDNVLVLRPPTSDSAAFRMTTEYMLFLPNEDIMRTDLEVIAYEGTAKMTGIGMEANNATRELFLLSQVKVVYPPVKSKK